MSATFILLLDTSGSMFGEEGEKTLALNLAVDNLQVGLRNLLPEPKVAIITFGKSPVLQDFVPISQISPKTYEAQGKTLLTEAVRLASSLSSGSFSQASQAPQTSQVSQASNEESITILVSDGAPNDGDFSKIPLAGQKYAIAIGIDADYEQLARFTQNPNRVMPPHEAGHLPAYALTNYRSD